MKTLQNYQKIQQALKKDGISWLKDLKEETLNIESELIEIKTANQILNEFKATQGWVQTLDKVSIINKDKAIQDQGIIINAELVNQQGDSLHLRQQGKQLRKTIYKQATTGEKLIYTQAKQVIEHLEAKNYTALYQVYWNPKNTQQPKYSRLIDITNKPTPKGAK